MTTICWDGRTLAVDCASWQSEYVWSPVKKLFHITPCEECHKRFMLPADPLSRLVWDAAGNALPANPLSRLVWAAAGDASIVPLIVTWMECGGTVPAGDDKDIKSHGLILDINTGRIHRLTSRMTLENLGGGMPIADGGGFGIALGAMLAGATAERAIKIVSSRSGWSAGGVDSYTLENGVRFVQTIA